LIFHPATLPMLQMAVKDELLNGRNGTLFGWIAFARDEDLSYFLYSLNERK